MDINTVRSFRSARVREELALAPGEVLLGGGTWLYSEPQPETTGFVDLTTLGWTPIERTADGLSVAATCTIAELSRYTGPDTWRAVPLFFQCASALLASFKIWNVATVGGNICRSFAAAGMVSLATALDADAVIWEPDGGERREKVADLITGNGTNTLGAGDVLRSIEFPESTLRSRTGFRKIALAELGRSGAVVTGRQDEDGGAVFAVTAATLTPWVCRFDAVPTSDTLRDRIGGAPDFYTDPLGSADWRKAVSVALAEEIRTELAA